MALRNCLRLMACPWKEARKKLRDDGQAVLRLPVVRRRLPAKHKEAEKVGRFFKQWERYEKTETIGKISGSQGQFRSQAFCAFNWDGSRNPASFKSI
jgi:hypothetical protein